MKIKNRNRIAKRLLSIILCFCCSVIAFIPLMTLSAQATETGEPSVSLKWKTGTATINGAAVSTNSQNLTAVLELTGNAEGTVKVEVATFDISANTSYYTSLSKTYELSNNKRTVEITVQNASSSPLNNKNYSVKVEGTTYNKQFGLRIVNIENAQKDPDHNTLRAQSRFSETTVIPVEKNSTHYHYNTSNTAGNLLSGYVYKDVANEWQNNLNIGTAHEGSSAKASFNLYNALDSQYVKNLYNLNPDAYVYFRGDGYIDDKALKWVGGFNFKVFDNNNTSTVFFEATRTDRGYDNTYFSWFEFDYNSGGVSVDKRENVSVRSGNGTKFQAIKSTAENIGIDFYNRSDHAKKYLSSFRYTAFLADNDAPKVISYTTGSSTFGKNDTVFISVKFDEPVQIDPNGKDINNKPVKLALQTLIGETEVIFEYVDGAFTDTLIFGAKLDRELFSDNIKILSFKNCYSAGNGGVRVMDMMWNTMNQNNLFDAPKGNTSNPLATIKVNIDTRDPEIELYSSDVTYETAREHSVKLKISNISQNGSVYYAWSTEESSAQITNWTQTSFNTSGSTSISGKDLTGNYFLHVKGVSSTGQITYWRSDRAFSYDNEFPCIESVFCANPTAQTTYHTISVTIPKTQIDKLACVYMYVVDSDGTYLINNTQVYNKSAQSESDMQFEGNIGTITIDVDCLGLIDGDLRWVSIGFVALDKYGNETPSPVYSTQIVFDNRSDFKAEIAEPAIRDLNGYKVYLNNDNTYTIKFAPSDNTSSEELTGINVYGIFSIKKNGEYLFNLADSNNNGGKTYTLSDLKNDSTVTELKNSLEELFAVDGWLKGRRAASEGFSFEYSDKTTLKMTLDENARGFYEFVFFANEKRAEAKLFITSGEDDTENYLNLTTSGLLSNEVWKFTTNKFYSFVISEDVSGSPTYNVSGTSYCENNAYPIFSSREKAYEYALFMELQDVQIVYLDPSMSSAVDMLNGAGSSGHFVKASGETMTAAVGQTWIRYKNSSWNPQVTTSSQNWVYYYYGNGKSDFLDLDLIFPAGRTTLLGKALDDNAKDICGYDTEYTYLTKNNSSVDQNGEPTYSEKAVFPDRIEAQGVFTSALVFNGDSEIYNNSISYPWGSENLDNVILVSNYTFTANTCTTTIYYRLYAGEDNSTRYQVLQLEKGKTAELDSIISASGLYEIIETGEGYRKFCIYVDNDVPVLEYEYVRNGKTFTGYIDSVLNGTTIRGSRFVLKNIVTSSNGSYNVEYDKQAYVYVTNSAGTRVVLFATLSQLAASEGIEVPEGNYKLYVYDRLGNYTRVDLKTNSTALEILGEVNTAGDALIVDINRNKTEIESFSITRNGLECDIDYEANMKFHQSGIYVVTVSDIYGESSTQTFELDRGLPIVEFFYKNESGHFVPFGNEIDGGAYIESMDETMYQIITSSDVKIKYSGSYTFTAVTGDPTITPALLGGSVTVSDNDSSGWTVRISLTNDPSTCIYVSCGYDTEAPQINVTGNVPTYSFNEQNGKNNVLFEKLSKTKVIGISDGDKLSCESIDITWSDQSTIREAYYLKDGEKHSLTEEEFYAQAITLTEKGEYEIFVTDIVNNTSSFKFTLSEKIALEYLIDGVSTAYHSDPISMISGNTFNYTQKTGKEIILRLGEPIIFAFMYTDENETYIFELYYDGNEFTAFIYDYEEQTLIDSFKSIGNEGKIFDQKAYPIDLSYKFENGIANLIIPECDKEYELWQIRITDDNSSYPYIIQIERSDKLPSVEFVKEGENTPLEFEANTFVGVNTTVEVLSSSVDPTISKITAYYSSEYTTDFESAEMFVIYNSSKLENLTDEGYYKIVVKNVYGNDQTVFIRIGYEFDISAEITYDSGDKTTYSLTDGEYALYTNNEAKIYVWADINECNVKATVDGSEYVPALKTQNAGFYFELSRVGEYEILISDSCDHEIKLNISIKSPVNIPYNDYLDGFNQQALYKDEAYTNSPLDILWDKIIADEIGRISYTYTENGITESTDVIYDVISQQKIESNEESLKKSIGVNGNGKYTVIFMDKYGNTVEKIVHISNAEQLLVFRVTLTDSTDQPCGLSEAMKKGAWSNRSIILKDISEASVLKINGKAVEFTDGEYRLDFPANLGQGHEKYNVEYLDEFGNSYSFTVNLYRKVPEVSFTEETKFTQINETVYVTGNFGYQWSDPNVTAVYSKGNDNVPYENGTTVFGDGTYVFTFTDLAGNTTVRKVVYDTVVDYKLLISHGEVKSGIATNETVSIKQNNESINIVSVKKDGKDITVESMNFSDHGFYEVTLGDVVGNTTVVKFYIITHAFNDFTYVVENGYAITEVWFTVDGFKLSYVGDVVTDENGVQSYKLLHVGTYELAITDLELNQSYRFNVTIDRTPPSAKLVGVKDKGITREPVTLTDLEIGDLVEVYKNGKLVFSKKVTTEITDPPMIESSGEFRIVITDEAGNSIEYTFEKEFTTNLASNVIILMIMLLMVAGAMMYLYLGKKVRIK